MEGPGTGHLLGQGNHRLRGDIQPPQSFLGTFLPVLCTDSREVENIGGINDRWGGGGPTFMSKSTS